MSAKRILLVDDSKSARFALRVLLKKQGFEVDTAESAEQALQILRESRPDAVFMDHMMPGMDGYEATAAIKNDPSTAHIPIVMCTSNDQEEYVHKARQTGALGILPKPATSEKLAEILGALEKHFVTPEPEQPGTPTPPVASEIETVLRKLLPQLLDDRLNTLVDEKLAAHTLRLRKEVATELQGHIAKIIDGHDQQLLHELQQRGQHSTEQLRRELDDKFRMLATDLVQDRAFNERIQVVAGNSARTEAQKIAAEQARDTAEQTAQDSLENAYIDFRARIRALHGKIYLFAGGAALLGIASAAFVYFRP